MEQGLGKNKKFFYKVYESLAGWETEMQPGRVVCTLCLGGDAMPA